MSRNLSQMRTLVTDLSGNILPNNFTERQIDAAIRTALEEYSNGRPMLATEIITGDGNTTITMAASFDADQIVQVQKWDSDPDNYVDIPFYAYRRDEQWMIETVGYLFSSSDTLIVTYGKTHTIDDLDGAAGTTIPTQDEHLLALGAAGFLLRQNAGVIE